jgi:lysyl-tRNA synthetase class 1
MNIIELSKKSNNWVWKEAWRLKDRFEKAPPAKGYVLFETGYGPSGLPHIGTFGEVFRTTQVRRAFEQISDIPTKMFCVSDDMDGMRKIPDNLPQQEMLAKYINKPLTAIPDPFGTHESYGKHMNSRLCAFLDKYGFEYEFKSATDLYKSGAFDEKLLLALKRYDAIMKIMLPTLGEERQQTYSPFLPISPVTGNVLYVPTKPNAANGTVIFTDEDGNEKEIPVTGGNCKMQWKPDFGMRWAALGVDFEMYGKDHLVNGKIYSDICKALDGKVPNQFNYELFLDEKGEKISKSKGNGISIDEWLNYGTQDSLALYMFMNPQRAKKLHFDVIPQHVDDFLKHAEALTKQTDEQKMDNPAWHITQGKGLLEKIPVSFSLLLNLAAVCNPDHKNVLWAFISQYADGVSQDKNPYMDKLCELAVRYYNDFVKPNKNYHVPNDAEKTILLQLKEFLATITPDKTAEEIQNGIYDIGMKGGYSENLKDWFKLIYMVLLGSTQGPRMGSFVKLYGASETIQLIEKKLA